MSRTILLFCLYAVCIPGLSGQVAARLSATPPFSPQSVANLEAQVQTNPDDLVARTALLRFYSETAPRPPNDDPAKRSARLRNILYLIEHHPESPVCGSPLTYVYKANGPYANEGDHEAARGAWVAAAQTHPDSAPVVLNAVRFLAVEDKTAAESLLQRQVAASPDNPELGANLGFVYAMEILGLDSMIRGGSPATGVPPLAAHAEAQLDQTSNPFVLAGAGTALPNLSIAAVANGNADPKIFDLAASLSARARRLAPGDPDIQGPMPLIQYFAAAQQAAAGPANQPPSVVPFHAPFQNPNLAGPVQAISPIQKTQPVYPERARQAGITGDVRLVAVIGSDGTVKRISLISGHPLLVEAAIEAVKTWLYRPPITNGAAAEISTEITVTFPPN